jgi:hypothetical protein
MSLKITDIRSAGPAEWDAIWEGCPYSTYFHSREWAEIWNIYTKGVICPDSKVIEFSDGKKALLPLSLNKSENCFLSSPAGTYGGWISTDSLGTEHAALLAKYLTEGTLNLTWRLNPYDKLAFKVGVNTTKSEKTHSLKLSDGFGTVYRKWETGSIARKVRKARKCGVSVRTASGPKDWNDYYEVYEDSLQRWGTNATSFYSRKLFDEMYRRDSPYIKLWLSVYHNRIIAGALCFYSKTHVVYWHGAALKNYFHLRPVNILMFEAIKQACQEGYIWFDFNPSGMHKGVEEFKKSFGSEVLKCPAIVLKTPEKTLVRKSDRG